jgi:glycolate oxidase
MNRIIEIDEKNMYAVVEPYVIAAQLEAEAEKVGLTAPIASSASHSILATCTSGWGISIKGTSCGYHDINLLGVEWVLPTGEVVKLGAVGAGAGWFSGDGPGPGLRGIVRGFSGGLSGNGVFTKCATKLYPWPGPAKPEVVGEHPQIGVNLPQNFKLLIAYWPGWDRQADAMFKINESEIGMVVWRTPAILMTMVLTGTNNENLRKPPQMLERYKFGIEVLIAAHSMREAEYQEKVLRDIVAETGGDFVPLDEEPFRDQIPVLLTYYVLNPYMARIFRPLGDWGTSLNVLESWDLSLKIQKLGEGILRESKELTMATPENFWGGAYAHNRYTAFEQVYFVDPTDRESRTAYKRYRDRTERALTEKKLGIPVIASAATREQLGPSYDNYHLWTKKVKKAIDPENLADHTCYVAPD